MIEDEKLSLVSLLRAIPVYSEGIAQLYHDAYRGKYPLVDFMNPDFIKNALQSGRYVWHIAVANGGKVVGSTVGIISPWNNSCELGKTVIDGEYVGNKIAKKICGRARDEALERGVDILWGTLRNKPILEISKSDGMHVVGYFPGAHLVNDREVHLIGARLSDKAKQQRVMPKNGELYSLPLVKRILHELDIEGSEVGDYPEKAVLTQDMEENFSVHGFYHPEDRSLTITRDEFVAPEYMQAIMPADKTEHIRRAFRRGFSITAFLPAWYVKEGRRYDCVLVTIPIVKPVSQDEKIEELKNEFAEGFEAFKSVVMSDDR